MVKTKSIINVKEKRIDPYIYIYYSYKDEIRQNVKKKLAYLEQNRRKALLF